MAWFNLTGPDPSQPASYTLDTGTTPPSCSNPPEQMCALQAANNGSGQPVITNALKDEIINCLHHQINDTNVKLKSR